MGRQCRICTSPFRVEYEKWFLEDGITQVMDIYHKARREKGEKALYGSFAEHFKNHVDKIKELNERIDSERKALYSRILKQDITIGEQLMKNLELCSNKIKSFATQQGITPEGEKLLISYLGETRLIAEEILRWKDKIRWEEPKDKPEFFVRVSDIFSEINLPLEYRLSFVQRWKDRESSTT